MNEPILDGPPALVFTPEDIDCANEAWGLNCGPGALCAVLGLTPDQVRPHLGEFESKRYTNPTAMLSALRSLRVDWESVGIDPIGGSNLEWPRFGLVRIQWAGPWTKPGVPIAARYRKTHWVATWTHPSGSRAVFDVNDPGHWATFEGWRDVLVPWLLKQAVPRATGDWWPTHSIEVHRAA